MKAYVLYQYGEAAEFQSVELPKPKVIPGHILIRVAATSVNPLDCGLRKRPGHPFAPELPAILHGDVSGIVEEVGEGVKDFKPGDEVYACAGGVKGTNGAGALADYMLADAALVAHKPKNLSMEEAAALPLVSLTAWEGLIDRAKVRPGQKVLVHGGTGGVGHIAVQLAKWAGATVYATASSKEKMELARKLGADVAIHYQEESVQDYVNRYTDGKGFDVVFDTVGGDNLDRSFQAAALYGHVVSIITNQPHNLNIVNLKGLTLHGILMLIPLLYNVNRHYPKQVLSQMAKLAEAGAVKPLLDPNIFPFSKALSAHRHLESGNAIGKVVLRNENFSK